MKKLTPQILKKIMKSYGASCICLLLSVIVFISGAVSYSRYVSGEEFFNQPGIGTFRTSSTVNDVSALSFTNMAFWGGLKDIGISMNSLRTVSFSVNNYEYSSDNTKLVSEVALKYSLVFQAPKNFAEKLAIQLHDENDTTLTSQIVLADLLSVSASSPNKTITTSDPLYNGKPYVGTDENGNYVSTMTFDLNYNADNGIYTATSRGGDGTVITIEPVVAENSDQTLYFRLWDVSKENSTNVTEEGGTLMPPIALTYTADIDCYKITVSRPEFKFPAGAETTHDYSLTLAPTDSLHDTHLGGYLMQKDGNTDQYISATTLQVGEPVYLSTVIETVATDITDSDNDPAVTETLMGNIPIYKLGSVPDVEYDPSTREYIITSAYTYTPEPTTVKDEEHSAEYFFNYSRRQWNVVTSESRANRRAIVTVNKTTTLTTVYDITVREITTVSDINQTVDSIDNISNNEKTVIQSGTRNTEKTYELIDASKKTTTEIEYSTVYEYYTRNNTYSDWRTTTASDFSGAGVAEPDLEHIHPSTPDSAVLTADEIAELKEVAEVQALLATQTTEEEFTKTITYISSMQQIIPSSISTTDESISTDPFKTHSDSGIQQYYVSTSFSKNYPLYVKIFIQQIQD